MSHHRERGSPARRGLLLSLPVVALTVLAVACQGGGPASTPKSEGQQLFDLNCATCHGASGEGLGVYPKLVGVADILGGDYARTVIAEGRNNMPEWGSKLTPAQIDEIVDYIATFHG